MKKILIVLALFLGASLQAEHVMCLDEDLVNQEIAGIMRSRGIEPYPHKAMQMRSLVHALCSATPFRGHTRKKPLNLAWMARPISRDVSSIADLYGHGFTYLQQGKWREAYGAWAVVALHYPTSDAEERMVNAAMNFVVHSHEHLFPVLRVITPTKSSDTSLLILPPLAPSTMLAAFLLG